jgi:hypothetical protein
MIGGVQLDGASCNLIDYETWSNLKNNNIDGQSTKSEKKLFACFPLILLRVVDAKLWYNSVFQNL